MLFILNNLNSNSNRLHYLYFFSFCSIRSSNRYNICIIIVAVQFAWSCPTHCDPVNCSTPGVSVLHHLLEFAQIHVHWVSDATQPSHSLMPLFPLALNPSQNQGLFQWVCFCIRWSKHWRPKYINSSKSSISKKQIMQSKNVCISHSVVSDSLIPWTVTHQTPLSMEFSRQEYWSGLPFPSPGDLPHPVIEPRSSALQADSLSSEPSGKI